MSKRRINTLLKLLVLTSSLFSISSNALESDKGLPLSFEHDGDLKMRIEDGSRIMEMSTNVKVTQGTLEILGDNAIFEYDAATGELDRVTVHGNPVRYQQQVDEEGGMLIGTSKTLVFYTDEIDGGSIVELIEEASIKTPDSTWSCRSIIYAVDDNFLRDSSGPCAGMIPSNN